MQYRIQWYRDLCLHFVSTGAGPPTGSLTDRSNVDEALAGFRALDEDFKLFGQLITRRTVFLGFTGYTHHEIGRHIRDGYGSENAAKWGNKLILDCFDGYVIDETFQSNLGTRQRISNGRGSSRSNYNLGVRPCNKRPYSPKLQNRRSDPYLVPYIAAKQ